MNRPPIESERRKPDFRGDVPITLADGNAWYFPRPRLRGKYLAYADPSGSGDATRAVAVSVTEYGPEYDFRVEEALIANFNNQLLDPQIDWFARFLLRQNYDLDDRDFYWLLRLDRDNEDNNLMWMNIFCLSCDLVMLRAPEGPKAPSPDAAASSNGSSAACSPTASIPEACPSGPPTT